MALSCIEIASDETNEKIFKYPLEKGPPDEFVLAFEVFGILMIGIIPQPNKIIGQKLIHKSCFGEGFKSVEINKFTNFLPENLPIFTATFQEVCWENLINEIIQKLSNFKILREAMILKLRVNHGPQLRVFC